jgi:hypothetical protein
MAPNPSGLTPAVEAPGSGESPRQGLLALTTTFGTSQLTAVTSFMAAVGAAWVGFGTLATKLGLTDKECTAILCGLLALLFTFHTLPILLQKRKKLRLASITGATRAGYFQLAVRDDEEGFARADGKHEQILKWLRHAPGRVLYLTGSSGAGKSSLLVAWVLPKLEREGVRIIRLRGYQDPAQALEDELKRSGSVWKKSPPDTTDLSALFEQAVAHLRPSRILVVFDQFEEFLILQEGPHRNRFIEFLAAQAKLRGNDSTLLLVFRSEYDGFIAELNLPTPVYEQNFQKTSAFTERAGQEFLTGSGLKIEDQLMADVLREASRVEDTPGMIRPVTLNLCGLVLARFSAGLPLSFRPGHMIRGFVREAIFDKDIRDEAPALLRKLISEERTKRPCTIDELAEGTKLTPAQARGVMFKLSAPERGIVHPLDPDCRVWEISHDFLVPIVDSILASWRVSLWSKIQPWLPLAYAAVLLALLFAVPRLFPNPLELLVRLHWQTTTLNDTSVQDKPLLAQGIRYALTFSYPVSGQLMSSSVRPMQRLPSRYTVRFFGITSFDERTFRDWRSLNRLAALYMGGNHLTDMSGFKDLPHSLTMLGLADTTGHSSMRTADILNLPRNLTWLNIGFNGQISGDGLKALPPSLEWLSVDADSITDDDLGLLPTHLTTLYLEQNPQITDKGLDVLPKNSLQFLYLHGDPAISDAGLKKLPPTVKVYR